MKIKSRKKYIIIIGIIVAVIGAFMLMKNLNKNSRLDIIEYEGNIKVNNKLEKVKTRGNYYVVKNIVEKYYSSLCALNKTSIDILPFQEIENLDEELAKEIEYTKNQIYNFFDKDYIHEAGIFKNNLQEKLGNYNDLYVLIKDMYVSDMSGFLKVYLVSGTLTEKENLKKEEFKLMIVIDEKNKTFNIYTSEYISKHNLQELSNENTFKYTTVENRNYNKYKYKTINDEIYVEDLLKSYTQTIKYNDIDYIYSKLDNDYNNIKFDKIFKYNEYIEEHKKDINLAIMKNYKKQKYEGYTQYICIDQNGNYYIFKETAPMEYTLILDIYTIDLPEFVEKYENATKQEKVALNIQKVVEALNAKDYNYVYSKLADEFKENYFKTYKDFEKYASQTFDVENEVNFSTFTESQDLCTYKITLKGKNKTITKRIIMRLEEGTNFVMSFNVD